MFYVISINGTPIQINKKFIPAEYGINFIYVEMLHYRKHIADFIIMTKSQINNMELISDKINEDANFIMNNLPISRYIVKSVNAPRQPAINTRCKFKRHRKEVENLIGDSILFSTCDIARELLPKIVDTEPDEEFVDILKVLSSSVLPDLFPMEYITLKRKWGSVEIEWVHPELYSRDFPIEMFMPLIVFNIKRDFRIKLSNILASPSIKVIRKLKEKYGVFNARFKDDETLYYDDIDMMISDLATFGAKTMCAMLSKREIRRLKFDFEKVLLS